MGFICNCGHSWPYKSEKALRKHQRKDIHFEKLGLMRRQTAKPSNGLLAKAKRPIAKKRAKVASKESSDEDELPTVMEN
jgi:hypothetical protein